MRGCTTAEIEDHPRGDLRTHRREGRIDAALEAVARIRGDAELAARCRRAQRIEPGGFEEDIDGLVGAARRYAADDAAEGFRTRVIGDHRHVAVQCVGLVVERLQRLAVFGEARMDGARHLVGVEHMQRAAMGEGDVVGDVNQC